MTEKNSLVEEAIIQMKNLEQLVAENAKGILASTMKQEIKELVKESLKEQDEEDTDIDDSEIDDEDMDDEEMDMEEPEMDDEGMGMEEPSMDDETLDLTGMDSESVVKIFAALDDTDEVEVIPDEPGRVHFKDNRTNKEYIIMTEGEMEQEVDDAIKSTFTEDEEEFYSEFDDMEEPQPIQISEYDEDFDFSSEEEEEEDFDFSSEEEEEEEEEEFDFSGEEEEEEYFDMKSKDEPIYEIEMEVDENEEEDIFEMDMDIEEEDDEFEDFGSDIYEDEDEDEYVMEGKNSAKGKVGKGPKFSFDDYKKTLDHKAPKQKQGTRGVGMGKPKKDIYKKDSPSFKGEFSQKPTSSRKETKEGMKKSKMNPMGKKMETKEASRTLGNGKYWGREGLPKPKAAPRHLRTESFDNPELQVLREKNEEYRKALNIFRNKLDEVAIFNSNLAYATRLFTEHSTSKQEKINILKRFDGVETLKESKNLYKVIKDELTSSKPQQVNESVERTITKSPSTGSAINLIESKTYENPQFLRMKDLMSKLK